MQFKTTVIEQSNGDHRVIVESTCGVYGLWARLSDPEIFGEPAYKTTDEAAEALKQKIIEKAA